MRRMKSWRVVLASLKRIMTDSWVVFMYYIGIDESDKLTIGVVDFYGFVSLRRCTKGILIINMQPSIFLVKP